MYYKIYRMSETYYILHSKPYRFYVSVKVFEDHDTIHVGASMKCMTIEYDHLSNNFYLQSLGYSENCTIDENLKKEKERLQW